ncbi:unnamed protein product, partial [Effrenium voratum]
AGALLEDLGRSLRTVRSSADELANAGAILAEKGDRLADVATYIREAKAHSGKMQEMNAEILKLVKGRLGIISPAEAIFTLNTFAAKCCSAKSPKVIEWRGNKRSCPDESCTHNRCDRKKWQVEVVIITNSGFGWVHETASRFMPSILSELEQIPVISARAIFEPLGVAAPYRWKVLCFRRIVDLFSFDPEGKTGPSGLISVGDGWQERVAALMAAQDTDVGSVKCLKFLEQPGVDQLAQELDLCSQIFEGLAAHPSWVEASYSYTEAWGLQLEARAADTVALGGSFSAVEGTVEVVSDT